MGELESTLTPRVQQHLGFRLALVAIATSAICFLSDGRFSATIRFDLSPLATWEVRMNVKVDEASLDSALQALAVLDWILVRIVFNVRARTAKALRQDLAQAGVDVPESIMESAKWYRAFHGALSVANHKDGFLGLLSNRLFELGYEQSTIRDAVNCFEQDLATLCVDVQTAVARELRRDLEVTGIRVPSSILASARWRDVFARGEVHLPPGATSIVQNGSDDALFSPVQESSTFNSK